MILVDSSVWIARIRNEQGPAPKKLEAILGREFVVVGDLILVEVLQGARSDRDAATLARELRKLPIVSLLGEDIALQAAANHRKLRSLGVTPRGTIDVIVATWCVVRDYRLLHADRDFDLMGRHLGLRSL